MKLIKYSALLLSASLIFTNCKKEDQLIPKEQNTASASGQKTDSDVIPGKYIVVYKSDETTIAGISSMPSYQSRIAALRDHAGKLFAKHGISNKAIGETF